VRSSPEEGHCPSGGAGRSAEAGAQASRTAGPAVRTIRKDRGAERPRSGKAKAVPGEALPAGRQQCQPAGGKLDRSFRVTPGRAARRNNPAAQASRSGEALAIGGESRVNGGRPADGNRESGYPPESRRRRTIPGGMAPHPKGRGINHFSFCRPHRVPVPATGPMSRKLAPDPVCAGPAAQTKDP